MINILLFLTTIAVVAHSFQKHMMQRLHQLYKQYSYAAAENKEAEGDYCAVCLSQVCKGEKVRTLPVCNHRYHADCIGAWLKNHTTCPLCRNKIIDHIPHNQHKQLKQFRESMTDVLQGFSDMLVALVYMMLPDSIRETFPLVH